MAVYLSTDFGSWKLPQGESLLGRSADCQVHLDDLRLSRRHALLKLEDDELFVVDMGSQNGVLVNGDRILSATKLQQGDQMAAGPFVFAVRFEVEEKDPKKVESSVRSRKRSTSEEFKPSTDRSGKRTVDMEFNLETPANFADKDQAPEGTDPALEARGEGSKPSIALQAKPGPPRRPLAAGIAQAVSGPRDAQKPPTGTAVLMPSEAGRRISSEALTPLDEFGKPIKQSAEDSMNLKPVSVVEAPTISRVPAAAGDLLTTGIIATAAFIAPLLAAWSFATYQLTPDQWDIATALRPIMGLDGFDSFITQMSVWRHDGDTAFLIVVLGGLAGLLLALLTHIFLLVVPTLLRGAPLWHRRFRLVIIDERTGYYPNIWRAVTRCFWLVALAPISFIGIIFGQKGLHDMVSGCAVHKRG